MDEMKPKLITDFSSVSILNFETTFLPERSRSKPDQISCAIQCCAVDIWAM